MNGYPHQQNVAPRTCGERLAVVLAQTLAMAVLFSAQYGMRLAKATSKRRKE
jgi:hypothetical protein